MVAILAALMSPTSCLHSLQCVLVAFSQVDGKSGAWQKLQGTFCAICFRKSSANSLCVEAYLYLLTS